MCQKYSSFESRLQLLALVSFLFLYYVLVMCNLILTRKILFVVVSVAPEQPSTSGEYQVGKGSFPMIHTHIIFFGFMFYFKVKTDPANLLKELVVGCFQSRR
jgi:hypothetical protein